MGDLHVTVVSDTHLSDRTPEATANWRAVVDHITADPPDLVVHTGDLSTDGAARPEDLTVAARHLSWLGGGRHVLALPGNHDVGDNPHAERDVPGGLSDESPVSPERLDRYRQVVGPDRWSVDAGAWRLVGLDALVLGSGLDDEEEQWAWLAEALVLPPGGPRHVALFLHKPLRPAPDRPDGGSPGHYVVAGPRQRLDAAITAGHVRVVVSGHVHQYRRHRAWGVTEVWAPTTWTVVPDWAQPVLGDKTCGIARVTLAEDGAVAADLVVPAGLAQRVLIDDVPNPYRAEAS